MASTSIRSAYVDESFHEAGTNGFYVLVASIVTDDALDAVRTLMIQIRGRRRGTKLHFTEMSDRERRSAAERLAEVDGSYVTTVASPVGPRQQRRARALCLGVLVEEIAGRGVVEIVAEARQRVLDRHDADTVRRARGTRRHPHISHRRGIEEPALWTADIVAGAVRLGRRGDPACLRCLDGRIDLHEVAL